MNLSMECHVRVLLTLLTCCCSSLLVQAFGRPAYWITLPPRVIGMEMNMLVRYGSTSCFCWNKLDLDQGSTCFESVLVAGCYFLDLCKVIVNSPLHHHLGE